MNDVKTMALDEKTGKLLDIPPIDELCKILKKKFEHQSDLNERLKQENEELKNEHYKDEELQKMKRDLEFYKDEWLRGFAISKEENDKIHEWVDKHTEEKHNGNHYSGAISGRYTYIFCPTSIGTIGKIKCSCGEEFEFQNTL